MGFIEKNLSANERVVYKGSIHWFIYFRGAFFIILSLFFINVSSSVTGFLFLVGVAMLLMAILLVSSSEIAVTNKRVILKTGIMSRKVIELQLNKSEGLQISEGMLGYGSIKITSGGIVESFSFLAKPFDFKKQVNNAIEGSFAVNTNPSNL
jgi:uncharacterized membrane protein YdbT with pleckstrin-like domain